ncbi:hypothetical protein [Halomicrobium katesii]|uniref:hypothetical protein n=1 Tax=Halomicrobium katesii TaxID=437163 RepID=UPI0012BABA4A|nr:hypothetical protein [Halomicrobium katesii]
MSDASDLDEKFEYDGRLVFNGLYLDAEDQAPFSSKEDLLNELPEFEQGVPRKPGRGFKDLSLEEWNERYSELPRELEEVLDQSWDVEYKHEKFDTPDDLVDTDGNPVKGWVAEDWSAYVYWYPGEFLIIQASQSKLNEVEDKLFPVVGRTNFEVNDSGAENGDDGNSDSNGAEEGLFSPEFLQWLVWKYDTLGSASKLGINELTDAAMSGNLGDFGRTNEVSESDNITNSHPIIAGMLENRKFEEIEGVFEIHDHEIDAQIYRDGSIRVMAQEAIGDATQYVRILLANLFMKRVLEVYLQWRSMPPEEKYVDPEYFKDLHEKAKDMPEAATYDFGFESLVLHYANLRNEDPGDYDWDFET